MDSPKAESKTIGRETGGAVAAVSGPATSATDDTPAAAVASSPERKHKRLRPPNQPKEISRPTGADSLPSLSLSSLVDQFCLDLDAGDQVLGDAQAAVAAAEKRSTQKTKADKDEQKAVDNNDNDDLYALIARWKEAGRLAAEEVFALVSERVARAGGVKAWHAMTSQQPEIERSSNRRAGSGGRGESDEEEEEDEAGEQEAAEEEDEIGNEVSFGATDALMRACGHGDHHS